MCRDLRGACVETLIIALYRPRAGDLSACWGSSSAWMMYVDGWFSLREAVGPVFHSALRRGAPLTG